MSVSLGLQNRVSYLVRIWSHRGVRTEEVLELLEDDMSGKTVAGHPPLLLVRGCLGHAKQAARQNYLNVWTDVGLSQAGGNVDAGCARSWVSMLW